MSTLDSHLSDAATDGAAQPVEPNVVLSSTIPALDYGRGRQPSRLRPRHAAVAALLLGCVVGSWVLGRSARERTQDLLYQRQASRHVESASTVVYESDPSIAQSLIDAGTHVSLSETEPVPAVLREPESMRVLRSATGGNSLETVGALVFLHELVTPSGARRIVAVQFLPHYLDGRDLPGTGLVAHIFEPGGFISEPRHVGRSHARLLLPKTEPTLQAPLPPIDPMMASNSSAACVGLTSPVLREAFDQWGDMETLRWYAGQPDDLDPTHFTIDYEIAGVRGTVDGYLSDDGRHVRMQPRQSRATADHNITQIGDRH